MKHIPFRSLVMCSSLFAACTQGKPSTSETKEAPDRNSSFEILGDVGSPTYEMLVPQKEIITPRQPWTDTYWPLTEKSLARRWVKDDKKVGLGNFFASQTQAGKEAKLDVNLSPADKYDILFRWRHGIAIDEVATSELTKGWDLLETGIDLDAEPALNKATLKTTMTQFNSPGLAGFRKQFPMSSNGWSQWLSYSSSDQYMFMDREDSGEDWSWMGSCHGWAPAALMAETPKHSVLVKFEEKEVLVTEGDIRGLLTKSWADHSPSKEQFFVGRRCNSNSADVEGDIPHSEGSQRGYYGEITRGDVKTGFYVKAELFTRFTNGRVYPVTYDDQQGGPDYLLETMQNRRYSYVLGKSLEALKAYVNGDKSGVEVLSAVEMFGCWDVNPATFHMALLEKIGKVGTGLVMDRTRTGQVWNQPVYGASFVIEGMIPISEAPRMQTRAPGTKYVAQVTAQVKWIGEPAEPHFTYSAAFNDEHSETSEYTYTLEFDRNHRLIGGEWGTLDATPVNQVTPDFLFGFNKGSKPIDDITNGFDYSGLIDQIHACSLNETIDGSVNVNGKDLPYSNCVLNKAD